MPGVPQQYATAMELGGAAIGLLVTSYDGRPDQDRGQPARTRSSRGAADALAQASVLELYDPDRSRQPIRREGGQELRAELGRLRGVRRPALRGPARGEGRGAGRALGGELLAEPRPAARRASPRSFPRRRGTSAEPLSRDNERDGRGAAVRRAAAGRMLRLEQADVIVVPRRRPALRPPGGGARTRATSPPRRRAEDGTMNRLYVGRDRALADRRRGGPPAGGALAAQVAGAGGARCARELVAARASRSPAGAGSARLARSADRGRAGVRSRAAGGGPGGARGPRPGRRRAAPAGRGARAGRADQRSRSATSARRSRYAREPGRRDRPHVGRRSRRLPRAMPAGPGARRWSSSAATRPTTRRPTSTSRERCAQVPTRDPPQPLRRRDLARVPLAPAARPLPRGLGRRARLGRHVLACSSR